MSKEVLANHETRLNSLEEEVRGSGSQILFTITQNKSSGTVYDLRSSAAWYTRTGNLTGFLENSLFMYTNHRIQFYYGSGSGKAELLVKDVHVQQYDNTSFRLMFAQNAGDYIVVINTGVMSSGQNASLLSIYSKFQGDLDNLARFGLLAQWQQEQRYREGTKVVYGTEPDRFIYEAKDEHISTTVFNDDIAHWRVISRAYTDEFNITGGLYRWATATDYSVDTAVLAPDRLSGNRYCVYVCIAQHTSDTGNAPNLDVAEAYWNLVGNNIVSWANGAKYYEADIVIYSGTLYSCLATHTATGLNVPGAGGAPWVAISGGGGGGGTGLTTTAVKTSTYTAAAAQRVPVDTTGGSFTVDLPPAPEHGNEVEIMDVGDDLQANNLTVGRNGENINGVAANATLNVDGSIVKFVYISTYGWRFV